MRRATSNATSTIAACLLCAVIGGCVEEHVIYDNSVDAKLNRSFKPGDVQKGGQGATPQGSTGDDFLHLPAGAQWQTNMKVDPTKSSFDDLPPPQH